MKIAISGSHGLVGAHLCKEFKDEGHSVTRIIRNVNVSTLQRGEEAIVWDINTREVNEQHFEGYDVVIHLAGASIAGRRWTPEYKKEIEDSRVKSTNFLANTLASLKQPPKILFTASAIGYYGSSLNSQRFDETSPKGKGFLADVCEKWEKAALPAQSKGIRVVHLRLGMILSAEGGALKQMLPVFRMGFGGKIGSGNQIISWVSVDEIPYIIQHIIKREDISGPVNCVSRISVSNMVFTKTLGDVLNRATSFPLPAFIARGMFGEMADELLIKGSYVVPRRLLDTGYNFKFYELKSALEAILK